MWPRYYPSHFGLRPLFEIRSLEISYFTLEISLVYIILYLVCAMYRSRRGRRFGRRRGSRRRQSGALRQLVRKQKRFQRKKAYIRKKRKYDQGSGFIFARYINSDLVVTSPGAVTNPIYDSISMALGDVTPDSTYIRLLAGIYQYYRLRKVVVQFIPNFTQLSLTSSGASPPSYNIGSIIDYKNETPAAAGSLDYSGFPNANTYKESRNNRWHTRVIKMVPSVPVESSFNNTGSFSAAKPRYSPWINTSQNSTRHYGLQYFVENTNGSYNPTPPYRIRIKSYWAFKSYQKQLTTSP